MKQDPALQRKGKIKRKWLKKLKYEQVGTFPMVYLPAAARLWSSASAGLVRAVTQRDFDS